MTEGAGGGPPQEAGGFAGHVVGTLATLVAGLSFSIVTAAVLAHALGPRGKGSVALLLLVANVLALIVAPGVVPANAFLSGRRAVSRADLRSTSAMIAVTGSALGGVLIWTSWRAALLSRVLPALAGATIVAVAAYLPVLLYGNALGGIAQGSGRIRAVNVARLTQGFVTVVATVVLVGILNGGVTGAVVAMALGSAAFIGALVAVIRERASRGRPRWTVAKKVFRYGVRGALAEGFQFLTYRVDLFIVGALRGPAAVGIYTVSVALAEMLFYLPNAVGFVVFPRAAGRDPAAIDAFVPRVFRITLALSVVSAVGIALVGEPVIAWIFGPSFHLAYTPLLALLPGAVLLGGAKVLANDLAGRGHPGLNSISSGLALVIGVGLDVILVPQRGIVGAAVASSASYASVFVTTWLFHAGIQRRARDATAPL